MPGSAEQRAKALTRATEIRLYRARLRRDIATGETDVGEVLRNPHPDIRNMLVRDVLTAIPRVGASTADLVLRASGTAPSKTVIAMTHRQVEAVIRLLDRPHKLQPRFTGHAA